MSVFVCKRHFWWRQIWRHLHVTMLKCWDNFSNVLMHWSIRIIPAKNYETEFKFDKVLSRNGFFFRTRRGSGIVPFRQESVGVSRECPNFLRFIPPIISGTVEATDFNFCRHIHMQHQSEEKRIKKFGKVAVGMHGQGLQNFSWHSYKGRIARLPLR